MAPRLGLRQRQALKFMRDHREGRWWSGCGWSANGPSATRRLMEVLEGKGLVIRLPDREVPVWEITAAGLSAIQTERADGSHTLSTPPQ